MHRRPTNEDPKRQIPSALSIIYKAQRNTDTNTNTNTRAKDTFPRFLRICNPTFSVNKQPPSKYSRPPPTQFVLIRFLLESTKTRLQNKNIKKNKTNININMNKKNRFLQCFRPVTTDGSLKTGRRTDGHRGDPVFTCIAAGENEGMMFRRILPPILVEDHIDKQEEGGGDGRLSRILKAVFTANSSAKKSKKRKRGQSSFRSETKITANTVEISNSPNENSMHKQKMFDDNNLRVDSHVSSSLRSSSAFTSTSLCTSCSCSRTTSDTRSSSKRSKSFGSNSVESKQRQDSVQEYGKGCQGSNVGLCLLLISLMVLIFWGKICAIFCTSTWLFLVRWSASNESPEDGIESPKIVSDSESEEYKKKVVMEGLLKRNRARGLLTL